MVDPNTGAFRAQLADESGKLVVISGLWGLTFRNGGSGGDPYGNGQSLGTLLGKILRIDPRPGSGRPYRIPAGNPFAGSTHTTFRVENRGNVRLSGTVTVSVAGPFGLGERKITLPDLTELLPGEDVALSTDLTDVPALMFDFTKVRIVPIGATGDGDVKASNGSSVNFAPPITALLVLLAAGLGFMALRKYRRRRKAETAAVLEVLADRDREPQLQSK